MADIDYGAIARSVREATAHLKDDLHRLEDSLLRTNRLSDRSDEMTHLIRSIDARLERLEQEVKRHDPRSETYMKQLNSEVLDLKKRFVVIERFIQQFSDYMQDKFEAEKSDREYRDTG